jgi:hypothetical protein
MKFLPSQDKELIYENMDVTTWWLINLFTLILELKTSFFFVSFFPWKTNKIFIVYNDFVGARYGIHHLKCNMGQNL